MRSLGILAVVVAVAVQAGDPPAAPVDSIAAAKRDFEAIKAAPADAGPPAGDRLANPEAADRPAVDPGAPERSLVGAHPPPGGTGNWLVDAMERKPGPAVGGDGLIPGGSDLLNPLGRGAAGEGTKADPAGASGPKVAPDSVVNPLDAFMEGWISARDKGLLLPERRALPFLGGTESRTPEAGAFLRLGSAGGTREAANPYVADSNPAVAPLAAPEVPTYNPLVLPDLSGQNPALGPATRPFDVPRLEMPDFAQPTGDDKYFRQMRRF